MITHVLLECCILLQEIEELLLFIVLESRKKAYPLGDQSLLKFCLHKLSTDVTQFYFEADRTRLVKSIMDERASAIDKLGYIGINDYENYGKQNAC